MLGSPAMATCIYVADLRRSQRIRQRLRFLFALLAFVWHVPLEVKAEGGIDNAPRRWAVIVVGLPGDEEHAKIFRETSTVWSKWCEESLQVPPERLRLLSGGMDAEVASPGTAAKRENVETTLRELAGQIQLDDSLWIFLLGHGHFDGKQAAMHLPGPDLYGVALANGLDQIRCKEQVVWLTQASSGGWVKPLSREGRIVIAATADETEENETEFPHALAKVMQAPPSELDVDHDQNVTLLELFRKVARDTQARFDADKRLATEHPQLDDNGDGRGTEIDAMEKAAEKVEPDPSNAVVAAVKPRDGEVARGVILLAVPPPEAKE